MSEGRLYFTESGQVAAGCNEEITRWIQARKTLKLDTAGSEGVVYVFCYEYPGNDLPLRVNVAGHELLIPPDPKRQGDFFWRAAAVPPDILRPGPVTFTFSCDTDRFNAWIIALDPTSSSNASYKSWDGGKTWQSEHMGFNFAARGDYVVRLWVRGPSVVMPPVQFRWEDPRHPRLAQLREALALDEVVAAGKDELQRQVALRSWVADQWTWSCGEAWSSYPVWDALTILDWARNNRGHGRPQPVRFCVHFGVVYAQCAMALGWPAKCIVMGPTRLGANDGHFVPEVWNRQLGKWIIMDASQDCHFETDGRPLNALEIHRLWVAGRSDEVKIVRGPNYEKNPTNQRHFLEEGIPKGLFGNFGTLPRNDFFTSPHEMPLEHGSKEYHETHFIWWQWQEANVDRLLFMPWHSDRESDFYPEPPAEWLG